MAYGQVVKRQAVSNINGEAAELQLIHEGKHHYVWKCKVGKQIMPLYDRRQQTPRVIEARTIKQAEKKLDKVLGDTGEDFTLIGTVTGRSTSSESNLKEVDRE